MQLPEHSLFLPLVRLLLVSLAPKLTPLANKQSNVFSTFWENQPTDVIVKVVSAY